MFDILVNTIFSGQDNGPGPGAPSAVTAGRFSQLTFSDPPTLAELERLAAERWHTRPDWWVEGRMPRNLNDDAGELPAGWSFDAGQNVITATGNAAGIDGWDFAVTETQVFISDGADVAFLTNCKFAPRSIVKADRVVGGQPVNQNQLPACLRFPANSTGRLRRLARCWFTANPAHLGGFGPAALILAQKTNDTAPAPTIDVMEFNSFEGYGQDATKGVFEGIRRYNYYDAPWNVPEDAAQWQPGVTYNRGDVVYDAANSFFQRLCLNDGTTNSPDWSSKNRSNTNWAFLDPHSDLDQALRTGGPIEWYGNVFVRDQNLRRFGSRKYNIGVVHALFYVVGQYDSVVIRDNLFTDEIEARNSGSEPINTPANSAIRPGETFTITGNTYQLDTLNANGNPGNQTTVGPNSGGWTAPGAATLSGITTLHGGGTDTLAYQFTASAGGWMTLVVNGSATPLTADQIIAARTGSAGVLAKFEIDAEAGVEALGFGDLVLSAGQTVYVHALYQAGGGVDTLAPVQVVTEGAGTTAAFSLDEMDYDGYVFDASRSDVAQVRLTGEGAAGDQIRMRGESSGGETAWATTFVRADGTWSATLEVAQADWGNWYTPAAQLGPDNSSRITGINTFGCGHVLMVLGQSEMRYWTSALAQFSQQTRELAAENLTMILEETDNGSGITAARLTSGNLSDANVGTLAVATAFRHIIGDDRKLCLIKAAVSGTSPFSLWRDSDTSRNWVTVAALAAKARASGSEIGGMICNWYNSPASSIDTMRQDWMPGMAGISVSGATFNLGSNNTEGAAYTGRIDHCFWDHAAAASARGRGLFSRDRTKLYLMLPMPFNDTSGSNNAFDEGRRMSNAERAGILAFANDSRVQTFLGAVGPGTHLACYDQEDTGTVQGIHPNRFDPLGTPWFANQHLPAILTAAGQAVGEPQITGVTRVNATTVDVTVSLPNGGTLTTLAGLGVGNHPASTTQANIPHLQDVIGFQIDRSGSAKRPIFNATGGAGEPTAYRGTVTIQDAGSGTGAARTGIVRIVLAQAAAVGDALTYLDGQANAVLDGSRDEAARLFNFMLLEHVSGWYDAGALYPYYGVPVRPQPPALTLT